MKGGIMRDGEVGAYDFAIVHRSDMSQTTFTQDKTDRKTSMKPMKTAGAPEAIFFQL